MVRELNINSKDREYEDQGYKFIPELGISVQGQSAPDAWREAARLAKKWNIEVWVDFVWRDNAKARHPGEHGLMRVKAKASG
ncbi:hypothetical protein R2C4_15915 [Leisingera aquaemixtae]|nr:hypothetical protein R2C4_15915 [Leisingera aquaemixtae]